MASTSVASGLTGRIRNATATLHDDNQSLATEILKAFGMLKSVAVALEKENQHEKVKELENAVIELLETYEDCMSFSKAIKSVEKKYEPGPELTDFSKLFGSEISKVKAKSAPITKHHPLIRQFMEAIWNVHHEGQPLPGDEQEEIVMTNTQGNLLNVTCPLSGKPVIALTAPVRSVQCQHIYEREAVLQYVRSGKGKAKCPISGCPKVVTAEKVECDPLLLYEIDLLRSAASKQTRGTGIVEDYTEYSAEEEGKEDD
ncbi:hypothetical protein MLD38_000621 [Melastoma candidum]|uniref:Uncharacterized protein n=1 Tax=Melastoma candidum TaxID=119954 RepID=A0ACB9SEM2_9MYRT|nr:hypothetical protein MLD38_000621 [Melastoma candidum]